VGRDAAGLVGGPPYAFADLSLEGGFFLDWGLPSAGARGGADRRRHHHDFPALIFGTSGWRCPRHPPRGLLGGLIRQADSQQRRSMELRALHVLEYSESDGGNCCAKAELFVGDGSAHERCIGLELGRVGGWSKATKPKLGFFAIERALGLVAGADGQLPR